MANWTDKRIDVKVDRVRYPKSQEGYEAGVPTFFIIKAFLLSGTSCTVKGKITHWPSTGEMLALDGKWEVSKFNGGMEFSFFHVKTLIPTDEHAMLAYACDITKGFGAAMEEKIWNALGGSWRGAVDVTIPGLTPAMKERFQKTIDMLDLEKGRSETIAWLISIGLTTKMAEYAFDLWKHNTVSIVKANCYALTALPHYSFKDIDTHIRQHFGITRNDTKRVNACINYCVAQLTVGSTVCTWKDLFAQVKQSIDAEPPLIVDATKKMFASGSLVPFKETQSIATKKAYTYEREIVDYFTSEVSFCSIYKPYEANLDFKLDESQLRAVHESLTSRCSIINGGAGCGKTSIIKCIADTLKLHAENFFLCAFAGKAAARLKEATGHEASTIHRMLCYCEGRGFTRKTLVGYTVIVDEASMIASDLLYEIVVRHPTRLILVGDEAQLPPVGAGQPFHDIVKLMPEKVSTLTSCYRNKEAIFKSAIAIREGKLPPSKEISAAEKWEIRHIGGASEAHKAVLNLVKEKQIDFSHDIILCARNGEADEETADSTVRALNRDIKNIVNRNEDGSESISQCDRIINTKNNAELNVWNGTTGYCDRFDEEGNMYVELDYPITEENRWGEETSTTSVCIPRKDIKNWQLAYALTVHKSQGSQYNNVVFICLMRDSHALLSRSMLYTAVTRAKQSCFVLADRNAVQTAINKLENKITVIQELVK